MDNMDNNELTTVFTLENRAMGEIVNIPMAKPENIRGGVWNGRTVLQIIQPGLEPLVDLIRVEEGATEGPYLRFLGSVATRETFEDDLENIIVGRIVGGYHLVLADPNDSSRTYLLPGRVDTEQAVSVRKSKAKPRRD